MASEPQSLDAVWASLGGDPWGHDRTPDVLVVGGSIRWVRLSRLLKELGMQPPQVRRILRDLGIPVAVLDGEGYVDCFAFERALFQYYHGSTDDMPRVAEWYDGCARRSILARLRDACAPVQSYYARRRGPRSLREDRVLDRKGMGSKAGIANKPQRPLADAAPPP